LVTNTRSPSTVSSGGVPSVPAETSGCPTETDAGAGRYFSVRSGSVAWTAVVACAQTSPDWTTSVGTVPPSISTVSGQTSSGASSLSGSFSVTKTTTACSPVSRPFRRFGPVPTPTTLARASKSSRTWSGTCII
jgi:hypothetical protein